MDVCKCGLTTGGRCPVCLTVAYEREEDMAEWKIPPLGIDQKIHQAIEDTNKHLLAILQVLQEQKKEEPVKAPQKKK